MKLHELYPYPSEYKQRKRLGRGAGTGQGCTAGKGHKGQKARAGSGPSPHFEGGQMPMSRRLPKYGFHNKFRVKYAEINVERLLSRFAGQEEITLEDLYKICDSRLPVKILGQGNVQRSITVHAHRFSKTAREKIEQAGGQAKALEG